MDSPGSVIGLRSLAQFDFDGRAALEDILKQSAYGGIDQAVASLSLFSHPETVRQTSNRAVFPCVRSLGRQDRYTFVERDGRRLGLDDNATAHAAFAWANQLRTNKGRDVQLNHIHSRRSDPDAFTSLANICLGPSFLAKLTDHSPYVAGLLQRRAFDLYGWAPDGEPAKPAGYNDLVWAEPLVPNYNVEQTLRGRMLKQPLHFATRVSREIGWAFSEYAPDLTL